jgi:hypothetical protein
MNRASSYSAARCRNVLQTSLSAKIHKSLERCENAPIMQSHEELEGIRGCAGRQP